MAVYKTGSQGDEVVRIQSRLKEFGYYRGPLDGLFGGGTESAIRRYQKDKGLKVDGAVGPKTWASLFGEPTPPRPSIHAKPVAERCLALTGTFETGTSVPDCFAGLSGDFDGQGLSFGVCQWNFGQRSLQPMLQDLIIKHENLMHSIFGSHFDQLAEVLEYGYEDQMTWVRSIQDPVRHYIYEPWRGMLKTLGRTDECQSLQAKYAQDKYQFGLGYCQKFGLKSQRAAALMFDIRVQNGSISSAVQMQIQEDINKLSSGLDSSALEVEKMRIVANRRAEASNPRWVEDVRSRKLCIANGKGLVHGIQFDLAEMFGLTLDAA